MSAGMQPAGLTTGEGSYENMDFGSAHTFCNWNAVIDIASLVNTYIKLSERET